VTGRGRKGPNLDNLRRDPGFVALMGRIESAMGAMGRLVSLGPSAPFVLLEPALEGRYTIERKLRRGGMASD
jgi:hypothetical protein